MKKMLLKKITIWDETNPLNGTIADILVEDGIIVEMAPSGKKQWNPEIPTALENAHICGGWHDKAIFITNNDLSLIPIYSQETGFKKISLIHFPEPIIEVYNHEIQELIIEHFIPLFLEDGQPIDIRGLHKASGWVLFLDDPLDTLNNLLGELHYTSKPIIIMPFERYNTHPYSVTYSTENLWKGINAIRPELLQAKLNAFIQLLSELDKIVVSPIINSGTLNFIPLISLIESYDSDGFPTKQLPPYSPQLIEQLKYLGSNIQHIAGVASCNWLNAQPKNFPWDIRPPEIFDISRTKKALHLLLVTIPIGKAIYTLTGGSKIAKELIQNTIFSLIENDIIFHNLK